MSKQRSCTKVNYAEMEVNVFKGFGAMASFRLICKQRCKSNYCRSLGVMRTEGRGDLLCLQIEYTARFI